ncbi:hypothetical protein BpHYR1_022835, partial [Brachionus plicatilis]
IFVIEHDGELPPFEVDFNERWSDYIDIEPNDIKMIKLFEQKVPRIFQNFLEVRASIGSPVQNPLRQKNLLEKDNL